MHDRPEHRLPRVSDEDIRVALVGELSDVSSGNRAKFRHFAKSHPDLMREIEFRAHIQAMGELSTVEQQKAAIDLAVFVLSVIEIAAERNDASASVGDEVPPPSAVPPVCRLTDVLFQVPPDLSTHHVV